MGMVDIIGLGVLVAAFAYAVYRTSTRDKRKDAATDRATNALYDSDAPPAGKPSEKPME